MIPPAVVQEIKRLLASGQYSGRKIARALGVSRGSVAAIAQGKRPDYEALRAGRTMGEESPGPLERCPGCGGMVHKPCRLCRLRRRLARTRGEPSSRDGKPPLELELAGEHRTRYEKVRARRIAAKRRSPHPFPQTAPG